MTPSVIPMTNGDTDTTQSDLGDGAFLRSHRTRLGLSQTDLERASGYTRSYIAQIERGRPVALATLAQLLLAASKAHQSREARI